ncbi:MAG: lamin tail domain-containing protein [Myxococcota bacterium]|nr:lamin tail domain-containing protein [Myxococcota bacterium]
MSRSAHFALLLAAAIFGFGCDQPLGTETSDPLRSAAGEGSSESEGGSATNPGDPVRLVLELSALELDSREVLEVTVWAEDKAGTLVEMSESCDFDSSDPEVLRFYEPALGQPLTAGDVWVDVSCAGLVVSEAVRVSLAPARGGDLVFNEVLADGRADGDPNGDGTLDGEEDEFVEIVNAADVTVDLSGVSLVEEDWPFIPRHVFPQGTYLRAGEALVLFGGGDPGFLEAENTQFAVAQTSDPGVDYGLALDDDEDSLHLLAAADGRPIASVLWGLVGSGEVVEAVRDASLVLAPEVYGSDYAVHTAATGSIGASSPGTHADGSSFSGPDLIYSGQD